MKAWMIAAFLLGTVPGMATAGVAALKSSSTCIDTMSVAQPWKGCRASTR